MIRIVTMLVVLLFSTEIFAQQTPLINKNTMLNAVDEIIVQNHLTGEYELIARNMLTRILTNGDLIEYMNKNLDTRNIKDYNQAKQEGYKLISLIRDVAMLRLSGNDVYQLLKANVQITDKMSSYECAQYFRKKLTGEEKRGRDIWEIASKLDIATFRTYVVGYEKSFALFLKNADESDKLSISELDNAKRSFLTSMKQFYQENPSVADFFNQGKNFNIGSDQEVCFIGRSFLKLIVEGDGPAAYNKATAYIHGLLFQ